MPFVHQDMTDLKKKDLCAHVQQVIQEMLSQLVFVVNVKLTTNVQITVLVSTTLVPILALDNVELMPNVKPKDI